MLWDAIPELTFQGPSSASRTGLRKLEELKPVENGATNQEMVQAEVSFQNVSRKKKEKKPTPVERKIFFYKAILEENANQVFDCRVLPALCKQLDYANKDWYLHDREANHRYLVLHYEHVQLKPERVRLKFGKTSMILPSLEESGDERGVPANPEEGANHAIHAVFFEGGIVGVEHYYPGPRASRIPEYFKAKFRKDFQPFSLVALMSSEGAEKFNDIERFRGVRVTIDSWEEQEDNTDIDELGLGLHDVIDKIRKSLKSPDIIKIEARATSASHSKIGNIVLNCIENMRKKAAARKYADAIEILGKPKSAKRSAWFDFNKEQLQYFATLAPLNTERRNVDTQEIFKRIEELYQQNQEIIVNAKSFLEI